MILKGFLNFLKQDGACAKGVLPSMEIKSSGQMQLVYFSQIAYLMYTKRV
jgi:hypothetical protein